MLDNKRLFDIAKTAKGISTPTLAKRWNVTPQAINQVINGKSKSKRIQRNLDAFIRSGLQDLKIQLYGPEKPQNGSLVNRVRKFLSFN